MFIRVDDRLVHGQVVTAWIKQLNAKKIFVVDDLAASNPIISKALIMATPKHVELVIKNVEDAKTSIAELNEAETMIITKAPVNVNALVDADEKFDWTINVGNIGMAKGREKYAQTVHLDEENLAAINSLKTKSNVEIFMQTVPGQSINKFD
ncbi:PTS sugar transporter subunit IIB [Listeria sp. FSL L7-1485]|uniref:PTS sugar transporter subunit IIB n=1 Tax=Listeria immobilis TaxID=2713502 RepID=A0A7X0X915_9LIST|nr:PTS sugar transporter subunit IIB [Listeria immobilis]MBC1489835.1 PTS sugar transporter subunit IIB [Listeria immobilis]MBC1536858.1 PTS sugar transporter subunit IIB [Listeria immobilis]